MKIHLDRATDALYIRLEYSPIIGSEAVYPGIVVDFNADDEVVAIEVLGVQKRFPLGDLEPIEFEVA